MPGRYSKDTPEMRTRLLRLLLEGQTLSAAAESVGICRETFLRYRRDPGFDTAVRRAMAQAHARNTSVILKCAFGGEIKRKRTYVQRDGAKVEEVEYTQPDWQAAAWYLERTHPAVWGRERANGKSLTSLSDFELLEKLGAALEEDRRLLYGDGGEPPATYLLPDAAPESPALDSHAEDLAEGDGPAYAAL